MITIELHAVFSYVFHTVYISGSDRIMLNMYIIYCLDIAVSQCRIDLFDLSLLLRSVFRSSKPLGVCTRGHADILGLMKRPQIARPAQVV